MPFTGAVVVHPLGVHRVRITGGSLGSGGAGTITAAGGGGDVTLPTTFPSLDADRTKCSVVHAAAPPVGGTPLITVAKSGGPPITTFTITNVDPANPSGELEIWVEFIHSAIA